MFEFLKNAPTRLLIIILVLMVGATGVVVQLSGLSKPIALWLFCFLSVIEGVLLFWPKFSQFASGRRYMLFIAIVLFIGAGIYLYFAHVVAPKAIANAQHSPQLESH
jgi:predicted membrane channel-forming protein YqfA (hemolysin III family)